MKDFLACTELVTLVHHVKTADSDLYVCYPIQGVSWYAKTETAVTPMKRRQKKTAADTPIQKILRVAVFRRECKQYLREYGFTPVMGCAQIDHTPYGLVRSPRAPAVGVACLAPVKRGNNLSPPSAALPTPLYPLHLPVTRKTHPAFVHLQRLFLQPSILR